MKLKSLVLTIGVVFLFGCRQNSSDEIISQYTIAFGSCSHQWDPQPIWREIVKNEPDVWIWLGDIIYADTENMAKMKKDYEEQKSNIDYNYLRSSSKVFGIWDDHDYGANNSGKEYALKDSSKPLLFNSFSNHAH